MGNPIKYSDYYFLSFKYFFKPDLNIYCILQYVT